MNMSVAYPVSFSKHLLQQIPNRTLLYQGGRIVSCVDANISLCILMPSIARRLMLPATKP